MSLKESLKWYENFENFISQNEFMWKVVDELDSAENETDVKTIQSKYSNIFIFNNNIEEDIAPYIPSTNFGYELICNKYGNVAIAGKIVNFNNLKSFQEYRTFQENASIENNKFYITRSDLRTKIAGVFAETKDRKFWAEAWSNNITGWVDLKLTAHKKKRLYWNKYRTEYYLKLDKGQSKGWTYTSDFYNAIFNVSYKDFYNTGEIASGDYRPFVRLAHSGTARFELTAYTRGVGEANKKTFAVNSIF